MRRRCCLGDTAHNNEIQHKVRIWRPGSGAKSSGRTDVFFSSFLLRTNVQMYK